MVIIILSPETSKKNHAHNWVFPKIWENPQIIPFVHRVFHDFYHPFWGTSIVWKHPMELEDIPLPLRSNLLLRIIHGLHEVPCRLRHLTTWNGWGFWWNVDQNIILVPQRWGVRGPKDDTWNGGVKLFISSLVVVHQLYHICFFQNRFPIWFMKIPIWLMERFLWLL